jgi:hypothetical protein
MFKRRYVSLCLEIIFIVIVIAGGLHVLETRIRLPIYDSDEVSWIFTGYYFNLYFLRFDLFHSDWNDYDAYDQPPFGKYLVGAALYTKGYTIDSLEPKAFLNRIPLLNPQKYFDLVTPKVPNPRVVIPLLRRTIFSFALLSLLLLYLSIRILYGFLPAVISTALIITNPIFSTVSTRILGDPPLLFLFALFVLLCALYLKYRNSIYILPAFIVSSLAFSTKLNGILLVPMVMILFLLTNQIANWRQNLKVLMIGLIAFLLITVILNPVFINSGVSAIGRMANARLSAFRNYQETFKHAALLSVPQRFVAATEIIFFENSLFYRFIKVPVELILFFLGIYYAFSKRDPLLILILLFLVVIPISILPFKLPRYCYWIFPFTHIIGGQSANLFRDRLNRLRSLKHQEQRG